MKKFSKTFFSIALGALALYFGLYQFALNSPSAQFRPVAFEALYFYQREKLEGDKLELVFVGDSSLGNAIDAAFVRERTGQPAANLALTASFGLKGTLAMLEAAQKHNPNLSRAVIMHTLDMYQRPVASPYRPSRIRFGSYMIDYNIFDVGRLKALGISLVRWSGLANIRQRQIRIENDYMNQMKPRPFDNLAPLKEADMISAKLEGLSAIGAYCRKERIECVYLHGPAPEVYCKQSQPVIERINEAVRKSGLILGGTTPMCLNASQTGDAADHVLPSEKQNATRHYLGLLKNVLN